MWLPKSVWFILFYNKVILHYEFLINYSFSESSSDDEADEIEECDGE